MIPRVQIGPSDQGNFIRSRRRSSSCLQLTDHQDSSFCHQCSLYSRLTSLRFPMRSSQLSGHCSEVHHPWIALESPSTVAPPDVHPGQSIRPPHILHPFLMFNARRIVVLPPAGYRSNSDRLHCPLPRLLCLYLCLSLSLRKEQWFCLSHDSSFFLYFCLTQAIHPVCCPSGNNAPRRPSR